MGRARATRPERESPPRAEAVRLQQGSGAMARSKRKRTRRGEAPNKERLVQNAVRLLAAGNSKKALATLRQARFKGFPDQRLDPLFRRAYLQRALELDAAGLSEQAEAARRKAAEHGQPRGDTEPTAEDLVAYLRSVPADSRIAEYARYLRSNPPSPDAEALLANHLVMNRCWKQADALPDGCQFGSDAALFSRAAVFLDRGQWGRGLQLLEPLPAESGFRHWSAFGRAVHARANGNAGAVATAVSQVPSDFPLPSAVKALRASLRPAASGRRRKRTSMERLLGVGRQDGAEQAKALRAAWSERDTRRLGWAINDLAKAVDKRSPAVTALRLVSALELEVDRDELSVFDYWETFERAIPEARRNDSGALVCGQSIAKQPAGLESLPDMPDLLARVPYIFRDEADQRIARGAILMRIARLLKGARGARLSEEDSDPIWEILGEYDSWAEDEYAVTPRSAAIDLARMSVREDPSNAEAHKLLVSMLDSSFTVRQAERISAYESYAKGVPEELEPWIALAELYLRKNAYRKAETALRKARSSSRRDHRVIDLTTAASLLAAKRNLQQRRFALADRDIANAESSASPRSEALVLVWKAISRAAQGRESGVLASYERALEGRSPAVRAKAACMLLAAAPGVPRLVKLSRLNRKRLSRRALKEISAACKSAPLELAGLVEPMPSAFLCVTPENVVAPYLDGAWDKVLRAVPEKDALRVFPVAVEFGALSELSGEVRRRLPLARSKTRQRILLLYSATLRYMLMQDRGPERFQKLVDAIPAQEEGPVRAASERLSEAVARRFKPGLALALRFFMFGALGEPWDLF